MKHEWGDKQLNLGGSICFRVIIRPVPIVLLSKMHFYCVFDLQLRIKKTITTSTKLYDFIIEKLVKHDNQE